MKTNLHLFFIGLLFLSSNVLGQSTTPFTILRTNTDTANRQVFVEVMYEKPACSDYQAKFRLDMKSGKGSIIKVDSFLNNQGTFVNVGDSILQRPQAGGYKLLFKLPSNVSVADSPHICVVTQMLPYLCEGCGAGGSNVLFTTNDIPKSCPYTGDDLLACYWRKNSAGRNWEAWIQDARDCQPYRIVQMSDNRWWFAQNLNYQKNLSYRTLQSGSVTEVGNVGEFWCPSGLSAETNRHVATTTDSYNTSTNNSVIESSSCKTYGALYSWTTAMALNGRTTILDGASKPTPLGQPSNSQGICPDGWYLPSDYDFGVLFNAAEGCFPPTQINTAAPCNHNYDDATRGIFGSAKALVALKSTQSCHPHASVVDTFCATYNNSAWNWYRADYGGKISLPHALGKDTYGFSMLPAGHRAWNGSGYIDFGRRALFWTSSQYSATNVWFRDVNDSAVRRNIVPTSYGFSVRCIR